jgi:hypothetical protein
MSKQAIVIVNDCFGFGARFNVRAAEWNDKTVTFRFAKVVDGKLVADTRYSGSRHLRRTQSFAVITKELAAEANAINELQDAVSKRAAVFRERLKQVQAE